MNQKHLGNLLKQLGAAIQTQNHTPTPRPPQRFFASAPHTPHYPAPRLPKFVTNLDIKCSNGHFAPVPTSFIGYGKSTKGAPVANYRCPVCGRLHAVALNPQGKAFVLFTKG